MYEVVAEPPEPLEQAQQEERREPRPKAKFTPVLSSRRKASPGAHPFISNYDTYIYVAITCALGLGIYWNPSCMIPRFPRVVLICR